MTDSDAKADLHDYLQGAREVLLWKLGGLSEYDIRRPFTPTGTNLPAGDEAWWSDYRTQLEEAARTAV
jgi:hypothetical protein